MSEPTYFVRLRGKVSGPFTVTQLQAMHRRGHFSRFHQVSEDRTNWQPATALSQLFPTVPSSAPRGPSPAPPIDAAPDFPPDDPLPSRDGRTVIEGASPGASTVPLSCPAASTTAEWYYQDAEGNQRGPVSLEELRRLQQCGAIDETTLICKPGMEMWSTLDALEPGNAPSSARAPQTFRPDGGHTALSVPTAEQRSWRSVRDGITLLLAAQFIGLGTGTLGVFGFLILLMGSRSENSLLLLLLPLGLLALIALLVELVGTCHFLGAPPSGNARGVVLTALVVGLLCALLVSVRLALLWRQAFRPTLIASLLDGGVVLLGLARLFLFLHILRTVARGLTEQGLFRKLRTVRMALIWASVLLFLLAGSAALTVAGDLGGDGAIVVLLVTAALGVCCLCAFLGWYVWYLRILFRLRGLLGQRLTTP